VEFGRFRLDAHRRELLADRLAVPIGSRAFDILIALVEAGGRLVTKDELLRSVWSGTVVEEHNLQFQISTLRKALGPERWPGWSEQRFGSDRWFPCELSPLIAVVGRRVGRA
jgi:DNA-binding winged helix-turn-helix (wHTH) protein